jgi:pimeloyl-ACP methyl ester carboxylesterase
LHKTGPDNKPPSDSWAEVDELSVRYLDWGGNGPPVLALHGLASSAHWYDLVAPRLRDRYRIIAPDQRGHGKTTQAEGGYDWPTLASDAVGLMGRLDPGGFAVLGHSWGGNVAINVAALHPDRVSALVLIEGGIVAGPSRFAPTWEDFSRRLSPRNVSGTRRDFLERIESQLEMCWDDDVERIVQTMVWEDGQGQIQDILRPENQAQVIWQMWHRPASETWPLISCPTLMVVAGPRPDRVGSEFARVKQAGVKAASRAIKGSRVHWVPESIHDIGYHKPQELAEVIDGFLSGL